MNGRLTIPLLWGKTKVSLHWHFGAEPMGILSNHGIGSLKEWVLNRRYRSVISGYRTKNRKEYVLDYKIVESENMTDDVQMGTTKAYIKKVKAL